MMISVFCCLFAFGLTPSSGQSSLLCELENSHVTESSGVAASHRMRGIYWTHNDSGDGPNLYAFDENGKDLGTYTLQNAKAIDWEDMASAKIGGVPYLYIADVGDNARIRKEIVVYRVREPEAKPGIHTIREFDTYTLKYPDEAHDCEALIVSPKEELILITKERAGQPGVYMASLKDSKHSYTLEKLGELKMDNAVRANRLVTGADMSPDGQFVVVRTYFVAYLYDNSKGRWFEKAPRLLRIPFERQGEGICFDVFNKKRLLTTSEGKPCRVSVIPLLLK
ncbi:MAG TPA: hypothetical protein VNK96_06665 [Fimbriimonadales bacterium]|nr:hypothetical protein [Fimbriimonadales bacterium]